MHSYTLHTKAYMLHCIVWEAHNNNDLCPCKCEGQTTVIHRNDNRKLSTEREIDITRGAVETFGGRTLDLLCIAIELVIPSKLKNKHLL